MMFLLMLKKYLGATSKELQIEADRVIGRIR